MKRIITIVCAVAALIGAIIDIAVYVTPRLAAPRATTATPSVVVPSTTLSAVPSPVSVSPSPSARETAVTSTRALYVNSWSAADPRTMDALVQLAHRSGLNGVVIDVKDYSGRVAFLTGDPLVRRYGAEEKRIADFPALVAQLHRGGLSVIARIVVFQDPVLAAARADIAVHTTHGGTWYDSKGLGWVDPASLDAWEYNAAVARAAVQAGADEVNFDYVRYPSDGDLSQIAYPVTDLAKETRAKVIKNFFAYLRETLGGGNAKLSVDLFGLATVNTDDLGVGQVLENALPYFDYVCPMVYPSTYAPGFKGFDNPAEHPYDVVFQSLASAQTRRDLFMQRRPTTTVAEIRPWIQTFSLYADYTPERVRDELRAARDAKTTAGWMFWNAASVYNEEAMTPGATQ